MFLFYFFLVNHRHTADGRASEREREKQSKRETDHIPHTVLSLVQIYETRMHAIETITNGKKINGRDNAIAILAMCHVCSMVFMCAAHSVHCTLYSATLCCCSRAPEPGEAHI